MLLLDVNEIQFIKTKVYFVIQLTITYDFISIDIKKMISVISNE